MELHERADGLLVVNDAYNANPESMRAALETLARHRRRAAVGRTVAVLGEMVELGDGSAAAHTRSVGPYAARPGSTSWSPSATAPAHIADAASRRLVAVRRSSRRAGTRHSPGCERMSRPPTSSW